MSSRPRIPFNRPVFQGKELVYIANAIQNGRVSGDGAFSKQCHQLLEEALGVSKALLTPSCTHALEMAALLLEVGPGDEVLIPAFTFVSTVNAFILRGAAPVFVDIRPDTLNMDEGLVSELAGDRTKAVVPVHYAGVGCEMDAIMNLARERGIAVVEDNAHGLFGKYRGRYLGTFGTFATQSFHETKNFTCGEGGALLINDAQYVERAEVIREKGTNRSRFFRGEVDKYTWVDVGSSYLPSDVLAAFLFAQLEARERIQQYRANIWQRYYDGLADWAAEVGATLPTVPDHCEQAYHMFYLLMSTADAQQRFIAHLKAQGILAVFHYLPLHLSPMGERFGGVRGQCPVTESVAARLVRLPFYNDLSQADQDEVIAAARQFH